MEIIITKQQKNILLYAVVGVLIIFIFWGFIYLPSRRQVQLFQSQLDESEKQLDKIKKIKEVKDAISRGYVYTQSIEDLKGELAVLSESLAIEEEASLEYISSSARKLHLEVLLIKPSAKMPLLDKNKKHVDIAGARCFRLPVQLKLKGSYKAIGRYAEALRKDAPFLITVETLSMNRSAEPEILTADANLMVYLKSDK